MGDIIIRYVQLPRRVKALTATDENGDYNIYVNSLYNCDSQQKALQHELVHIGGDHFHRPTDTATDEKEAESDCGKSELCHSERSEESHTHPVKTQPASICDTLQSSTAQYDKATETAELCHYKAESRRIARAQQQYSSPATPPRTTVKVSAANIVPRPDFEKMRRIAGLSTHQAAKLAGISHTEYVKYECGLAPCPPLTAKTISAALTGYKKKK